jgi:hypothetical protein
VRAVSPQNPRSLALNIAQALTPCPSPKGRGETLQETFGTNETGRGGFAVWTAIAGTTCTSVQVAELARKAAARVRAANRALCPAARRHARIQDRAPRFALTAPFCRGGGRPARSEAF